MYYQAIAQLARNLQAINGWLDIPNAYFHIAMAYAILRQNGVDVGKMDFLGPLNWVRA